MVFPSPGGNHMGIQSLEFKIGQSLGLGAEKTGLPVQTIISRRFAYS